MTDAVSVILAQPHTVEIAARSQIDLACWFAGHQLSDGKLVCIDAMVEERRLFRRGTAGDSRPPQGGSVSFEARAHPQHDRIAPPDYAVGRSPYNCIDARAGTDHCVEAVAVSAEFLADGIACSRHFEFACTWRHGTQHRSHRLCGDPACSSEHLEFCRAFVVARLRHDVADLAQPNLPTVARLLRHGDDLL